MELKNLVKTSKEWAQPTKSFSLLSSNVLEIVIGFRCFYFLLVGCLFIEFLELKKDGSKKTFL